MPKKKSLDSKKIALLCKKSADNMKAENTTILEVRELTTVADYFVICGGNSTPQLRAISNEIITAVKEKFNRRPIVNSGSAESGWIVIDYGSVLVHIFLKPIREKYSLEELWSDAPKLENSRRKKKNER
ncbi:MAG TPA: ribosome silencing factor [Victivallales bacterium]|nr:ribosome silencing factor [Victivallales bacterium]HPO91583.1 ribosome silencing factor [Victivallales bacterium]HRR28867.1 ribosome silencing factor [Victivallales bacterium]